MTQNVSSHLLASAQRHPDRTAVETASRKITFAELMKSAGIVADELAAQGINEQSRLGIAMTRNEDALIVMLAAWLRGATALIADFRARAPERIKLAEALSLEFFVEDRPAPGGAGYPAVRMDISALCQNLSAKPLPPPPGENASPIAVIGVSSGTSGMPQPVALSHECLLARYEIARTSPQWKSGGRFAVSAPLAFSATRKHVLSRLLDGGTVIFIPLLAGAQEFADAVNAHQADAVLAVPAILRGLFPLAPADGHLFPQVSWLMSCGAPMLPQEKKEALGRLSPGFVQNYGSTMAGMITLLETKDIEPHAASVGRILPQVTVEIVDGENRPLPSGEAGQIRVRTPGIAGELSGKGDLPERNSDLVVDGWIYPGDIGALDADGFLIIIGRTSDMIIRGGINVFPGEVEEMLAGHPAVIEAAVVGWPDPVVGEEIAAFAVLREEVSPQAILAWCRSRIQPDKQPRDLFILPALPRNANGKVVKRELAAKLPQRAGASA
jgi:acyl-CoA synthetase (AMP-forming)/AMP-acid ligase II